MRLVHLHPEDAAGHRLAHAVMGPEGKIPKGRLLTEAMAKQLADAGIETLACACADEGDIHEDEAAARLAEGVIGGDCRISTAATGRVNLHAERLGLVRYDPERLKRFNLVDEGITLAVVQHNQLLAAGDMAATLKIIPFFVSAEAVAKAQAILDDGPLLSFHPLAAGSAWLIQSQFEHQPQRLFAATETITRQRVEQLGGNLIGTSLTDHTPEAIAAAIQQASDAGAEVILIAGASAIADRGDTLPMALIDAGGEVDHFGLAVDPGNLLMLGRLGEQRVIGMPGCARSPKLNGLDWVLQLHFAGIALDDAELADMAAGGLLMEIASRPLPRALAGRKQRPSHTEGVLLAAGASRRMGDANKLLAELDGKPMVRRVAEAMAASQIDSMTVILGHEAEAVAAALDGIEARFLYNPDYRDGQSRSLRLAVENLSPEATDMMVMLGDMPLVETSLIDRLLNHHREAENRASRITLPEYGGQRGNPVIWGEAFHDELAQITGDTGGRALFQSYPAAVNPLMIDDPAAFLDADTPEALAQLRQRFDAR